MFPFIELLTPPPEIGTAILVGLLFPLILLATRYVTAISDNPSRRYVAACAVTLLSWLALLFFMLPAPSSEVRREDLANGLLVLASSFIVFLGLWGVLTRGCSISILVALSQVGEAATETTLGEAYSGSRGLRWLTEKRLRSLVRAGLVKYQNGMILVTRPRGIIAAFVCSTLTKIIGLKNFG